MNFFITVFLFPINLLCHKLRYKSSLFDENLFLNDERHGVSVPHLIALFVNKEVVLVRIVLYKIADHRVDGLLLGQITSDISVNVFAFVLTHLSLPCWLNMELHVMQDNHVGVFDDLASVPNREAFLVEVVVDLYSHNF